MFGKFPSYGKPDFRNFAPQCAFQSFHNIPFLQRTLFTEPLDEQRAAHPKDVREDCGQLKTALLEMLFNAVFMANHFFDEDIPVPCPVT